MKLPYQALFHASSLAAESSDISPSDTSEVLGYNRHGPKPYCTPGHSCFPNRSELHRFNETVDGRMMRPQPLALSCYMGDSFNEGMCERVIERSDDPFWRADQPGCVQFTNWDGDGYTQTCPIPSPGISENYCKRGRTPAYVVMASNDKQVEEAVKFSARHHLRLRIRNTGHSYLGQSSQEGSFTINTHKMNSVSFVNDWKPVGHESCKRMQDEGMSAVIAGPGVYNEDLYRKAQEAGVSVVGGVSRAVGATGGFVLGGGHGPLSRKMGLGIDNVLQYKIVMADGKAIYANECQYQDLFYALRGAGQGAFGVVTEVVLRTHPKLKGVVAVTGRVNTQSQSAYREFVREWMKAHREFDHMGITGYNYLNQPSSLFVHLLPVKHNDEGDLEHWKGKMEEAFREPIEWIKKRDDMQLVDMNYSMQENFFEFYEKDFMEAFEGMDPVGVNLIVSSRLIHKKVMEDEEATRRLADTLSSISSPLIAHFTIGGRVSQVKPSETSINPAMRESLFIIEPVVEWPSMAPKDMVERTMRYLTDVTKKIGRVSGFSSDREASYMMESDPNEKDWQRVDFGKQNYDKLMNIKKKYDKEGTFSCYRCVGSDYFGH